MTATEAAASTRSAEPIDVVAERLNDPAVAASLVTLLDNAEVSLAKTDLDIARQYASLVESDAVRKQVFGMIESEYRRSVDAVLAINGHKELLETQPVLAQSIRLRNPYVDPLNYLQIRFLSLWRQADEAHRTEQLRRLLAITVKGVASGMKSTG